MLFPCAKLAFGVVSSEAEAESVSHTSVPAIWRGFSCSYTAVEYIGYRSSFLLNGFIMPGALRRMPRVAAVFGRPTLAFAVVYRTQQQHVRIRRSVGHWYLYIYIPGTAVVVVPGTAVSNRCPRSRWRCLAAIYMLCICCICCIYCAYGVFKICVLAVSVASEAGVSLSSSTV